MTEPYFEIDEHQEDGRLRLQLTGELDLASASLLKNRLEQLHAEQQSVRLDLTSLEFMDSTGIALLISTFKHVREDGWQLEIDPHLSPQVAALFRLTNVEPIIAWSSPTCLCCGDRIGIYEPIIVVDHDGERKTSLGREPELARRPRVLLLHSHCAPTDWDVRTRGVAARPDRQGTAPPLP